MFIPLVFIARISGENTNLSLTTDNHNDAAPDFDRLENEKLSKQMQGF